MNGHESTLPEGDNLHYYKGLIHQLIRTNKSVTFTSQCAPGDIDLKDHGLQPGDFPPVEKTLIKDASPTLLEGTLSGATCKRTSAPVSDTRPHLHQKLPKTRNLGCQR